MTTRGWTILIIVLAIIIAVLAWFFFTLPAPSNTPIATSTTPTSTTTSVATSTETPATSTPPLNERVVVTYPQKGATVQPSFEVIGKVPGNWSSEAQFPVMVRDPDGNKIAQTTGHLQGNWMTTDLVDFTADIVVSGYHGPATLVLLKDNPSGLPENEDSFEVPIVVQ